MTRKYQKYDKDFKLEASKLVTQHGYSYAEAARHLGLEDWAVRGWVKALRRPGNLSPIQDAETSEVAEDLRALRVEVAKLRMENDIPKKAAAYFAKDVL
jgi:transposase